MSEHRRYASTVAATAAWINSLPASKAKGLEGLGGQRHLATLLLAAANRLLEVERADRGQKEPDE